jgi:hypothetical protein
MINQNRIVQNNNNFVFEMEKSNVGYNIWHFEIANRIVNVTSVYAWRSYGKKMQLESFKKAKVDIPISKHLS